MSAPLSKPPPRGAIRLVMIAAGWLAALAIAFGFDSPVMQWMKTHPINKHSWLMAILRVPGDFLFTLCVCALLITIYRSRGARAAGHLVLSGMCGGLFYVVLKWSSGRRRPDRGAGPFEWTPFPNGLAGITHADNLSFPSGHVTLAFATAATCSIHFPRGRWLFFAGATLVAFERVRENAHYVADTVAGAMVGILSAHLIAWIFAGIEHRSHRRALQLAVDSPDRTRRIVHRAAQAPPARTAG